MSDDSDTKPARSRLSKPAPVSEEQIRLLDKLPRRDYFPGLARTVIVPENHSRKAYSVVRDIYLTVADSWWNKLIDCVEVPLSKEGVSKEEVAQLVAEVTELQKSLFQVEMWLKKPDAPLSLKAALKALEGSPSPLWTDTILKQIGKHSHAGQPASKRYLAVQALDLKCAYPHTSLTKVTSLLCPCKRQKHLPQCKEQLRQQIIRLVKFLRQHGHDFKWENISTWKWEPPDSSPLP